MLGVVAACVTAAAGSVLASASPTMAAPNYWTTAEAKTMLVSGAFYVVHHDLARDYPFEKDVLPRARKITSATCSGLGKVNTRKYGAFSCTAQWVIPSDSNHASGSTRVWLRPWSMPTRVAGMNGCISDDSLAACPPPPSPRSLGNDPRQCFGEESPRCARVNAAKAATAELRKERGTSAVWVNLGCNAVGLWTTFICSEQVPANGRSATVKFVTGKTAWQTRVVLHLTR